MSNLKSLVPTPWLCVQIPDGEFKDSALVWCRVRGEDVVCEREQWVGVDGTTPVPAPTTEEIIIDIGKTHKHPVLTYCHTYWDTTCYTGRTRSEIFGMKPAPTASESALRLWFKVKGIEVEE